MMQMNKVLSDHILGGTSTSKSTVSATSLKRPASSSKPKGSAKKAKRGGDKPARSQPKLKLSPELQAVVGHKALARTEVRLSSS